MFHAFSVNTNITVRDPWALPTAIEFHTFGVKTGLGSCVGVAHGY